MMVTFNAAYGLIVVSARLCGPTGETHVRLALDTGATSTGSGVQQSSKVSLARINALGHHHLDFLVIAHTIPISAGVDGVLGLDFMRGQRLTVNFRKGRIALT